MNLDPEIDYKLGKIIGTGNFGSVYIGEQIVDRWLVAIKVVPVVANTQLISEEIKNLKSCDSKFIVHYKEVFKKDSKFWIVMEYCHFGSLGAYLRQGFHLHESEIRDILACSLYGLLYLHHKNIIHRDIKPDNLFLSEDGVTKIGDFGLSSQLNSSVSHRSNVCGTYMYIAPEVFDGGTTKKSDIWALGITAIELAEGKNPYANCTTDAQVMRCIISKASPSLSSSQWSSEFIDFVNKCLIKDEHERSSAEELANHPFVKDAMDRIREIGQSETIVQLIHTFRLTSNNTIPSMNVNPLGVTVITPVMHVASTTPTNPVASTTPTNSATPATSTTSTTPSESATEDVILHINDDEDYYEISDNLQDIQTIKVTSNICNLEQIIEWNISKYSRLKHFIVGDNCFNYLHMLIIHDMIVETIQIGANSFRQCTAFEVKQCYHLQSITIGDNCFTECIQTVIDDCNQLQTILLGKEVFSGNDENQNSLIMKHLTALTEMKGKMNVFSKIKEVIIENVSALKTLKLPLAFMIVERVLLQNASLFDFIDVLEKVKNKTREKEEEKHTILQQQSAISAAQPASNDPFMTTPQDRMMYQQLFMQLDRDGSHLLPHEVVIKFYSQSGLPQLVLKKLFTMADLDKDDKLDFAEFVIITHILIIYRKGVPLPQELPKSLVPPSKAALLNVSALVPEAEEEESEEKFEESEEEDFITLHSIIHPRLRPGMMFTRLRSIADSNDDDDEAPAPRPKPGMMFTRLRSIADSSDDDEEAPTPRLRPDMEPRPRPDMIFPTSKPIIRARPSFVGSSNENEITQRKLIITVNELSDFQYVSENTLKLTIASNCCNENNIIVIDFSQYKKLRNIKIGAYCFKHVIQVIFNNMMSLQRIEIDKNSFAKQNTMNKRLFSLRCTNNPQLTSLTIGCYSFADFSECRLENCPSLQSITMGNSNNVSFNFYYANFNLSNLPQLQTIILGNGCFVQSVHTVIENLPQLKQIKLGICALQGNNEANCSLTMRNLPQLTTLTSKGDSFYNPRSVILENIPHVNHIDLPNTFNNVQSRTIYNVHSTLAKYIPSK